jgi:hypothetical protein
VLLLCYCYCFYIKLTAAKDETWTGVKYMHFTSPHLMYEGLSLARERWACACRPLIDGMRTLRFGQSRWIWIWIGMCSACLLKPMFDCFNRFHAFWYYYFLLYIDIADFVFFDRHTLVLVLLSLAYIHPSIHTQARVGNRVVFLIPRLS